MPSDDDEIDIDKLRRLLGTAVREQARSALHQTLIAGTLTGLETQAVADKLAGFAAEELVDTRRLIEKAHALGCSPDVEVDKLTAADVSADALETLKESEVKAIKALHDVIPETGQEEWSEALEHLLEHLIMHKQAQVDYLGRVLGHSGGKSGSRDSK
jgi:hypothetical protein